MQVIEHGIIFDARQAPPQRRFCSFTSLLCTADGRLLAAFRAGSSKDSADENILICESTDGGHSWELVWEGFPLEYAGVRGAWRAGALFELEPGRLLGYFTWFERTDPALPLSNPETQGILPSRLLLAESSDYGRSWHAWRELDVRPFEGVSATGAPLRLSDGALGFPYEAWKSYYDARPGTHHALLRRSPDAGRTFESPIIVAHDPAARVFYWDQRLGIAPDTGRLIALFWTHDRQLGQDRNIHVAWGSPDGRRWTSPPADTGFAGQIAYPLCLGGERVLAVYVHRHDPPSIRAVLSRDFGRTWELAEECVVYESAAGRESGVGGQREFGDYWADMNRWTFGHPEACLLPDGQVLAAFYAGDTTAMSMHWARLAL
jgi:hypothetical protein